MTRDEQIIKAALEMAAEAINADGDFVKAINLSDRIHAINPADVLTGLPPPADTITALTDRCRALEEAIHDADQTLMLLGDTGWRKRHRTALASTLPVDVNETPIR